MALNNHGGLPEVVDREVPLRHGIKHSDVLRSYIGLLCLGKSDFEAVSTIREDRFFTEALGISTVPSEVTLRQRFDARAEAFLPLVKEGAVAFLRDIGVKPTALETGHVPLDSAGDARH